MFRTTLRAMISLIMIVIGFVTYTAIGVFLVNLTSTSTDDWLIVPWMVGGVLFVVLGVILGRVRSK